MAGIRDVRCRARPGGRRGDSLSKPGPRSQKRAPRAVAPEKEFESIIPEILEEMKQDKVFQDTKDRMRLGQAELTAREARARERLLQDMGVPPWEAKMKV